MIDLDHPRTKKQLHQSASTAIGAELEAVRARLEAVALGISATAAERRHLSIKTHSTCPSKTPAYDARELGQAPIRKPYIAK